MRSFVLVVFVTLCFNALAQKAPKILSDEDTTAMHDAMTSSSKDSKLSAQEEADAKDSLTKAGYAIQRLREVINMKKDVLWSTALTSSIQEFEDSTYIMLNPMLKLNGNGIMIGLVSKVGQIAIDEPIDPYVNVYWVLSPVKDLETPFTLSVELVHSTMLPDALFTEALTAMRTHYQNKTYTQAEDSKEDMLAAMQAFIRVLKDKAGETYAPKYVFRIDGKEYRNGHIHTVMKNKSNLKDTSLWVYLIDRKTKETITTGLTWEGAPTSAYHALIDTRIIRKNQIKARIDGEVYEITIQVQGDDVLQVASQYFRDVFEEALVDAMQTIADTAKSKEVHYQQDKKIREDLRKQMIAQQVQICGGTSATSHTALNTSDSTAFIYEPVPAGIQSHPFLGRYINQANREHLAQVAFIFAWENRKAIAILTSDASSRAAFKESVLDNIGSLAAQVLIASMSKERAERKKILSSFIVTRISDATTAKLKTD